MSGPARQTSASVWGKSYEIWVVKTGKVTWMAYGDVTFTDSGGKQVTKHVSETGRSESAAINGWADCARVTMDY